jgi:hypothetical protein
MALMVMNLVIDAPEPTEEAMRHYPGKSEFEVTGELLARASKIAGAVLSELGFEVLAAVIAEAPQDLADSTREEEFRETLAALALKGPPEAAAKGRTEDPPIGMYL